jgi:hypothetical protein
MGAPRVWDRTEAPVPCSALAWSTSALNYGPPCQNLTRAGPEMAPSLATVRLPGPPWGTGPLKPLAC